MSKPERIPSLWDQLPKDERERITKHLNSQRPSAANGASKNGSGGFKLEGYARCELSASDKDAFRLWEQDHTPEWAYGILVKLVDSGYLLKIGEQGNGFQASLCAASTGKPWDGHVLVAHAGAGARSALLLVFKHEVLMRGDWEPFVGDGGEDGLR
jgi:hypothetical protein